MTDEHPMTIVTRPNLSAAEKIRAQAIQICIDTLRELSRKQEGALRRSMIREANTYSAQSDLVRSLAEKISQLPIPIPKDDAPSAPKVPLSPE